MRHDASPVARREVKAVRAVFDRAWRRVTDEAEQHRNGFDVRLGGYAVAAGAYVVSAAAIGGLVQVLRRQVPPLGTTDVAMLALATNRLARIVSREPIASPLRAPFTRATGELAGPAQLVEEPRGSGARKVVGELVTCPFCLSQWVATALAAGMVLAPRSGTFVVRVMASLGVADFLQFGWAKAEQATH